MLRNAGTAHAVIRVPCDLKFRGKSRAFSAEIPSAEPSRRKAYANDLRWRMVYQRIGMHLPIERIAENLNVSASTVCRVMERFNRSGGVDPEDPHKRRPDLRRLDERSEIYMVGLLLYTESNNVFRRSVPRNL